jgi:hypothetical protein
VTIPKDPSTLYAFAGALARKATDTNIDRVVELANRLPAEFSVVLMRDVTRLCPDLQNTKAVISWTVAHKDVLL